MSLDLDKRQRAMLREMGVRVWLPAAAAPQAAVAIDLVAGGAQPATPEGGFDQRAGASFAPSMPYTPPAPVAPREAAPAARPVPQPARPQVEARDAAAPGTAAAWRMGGAQALYAEAAHAEGARWLVLAETPAAALQREPFNPFEGDAGKLLDNMLRAARLHKAGMVLLAPLVRLAASGAGTGLLEALPALVASAQPDVVLVMGRLAAQAVLQSAEPFGKQRGQLHSLHGTRMVVTYDATYLLRNPADKGKAWDDLCLAMSLVLPG